MTRFAAAAAAAVVSHASHTVTDWTPDGGADLQVMRAGHDGTDALWQLAASASTVLVIYAAFLCKCDLM